MSAARTWWIYALRDPRTDETRYVGVSIDPRRRHIAHVHSPRSKAKRDRDTHRARWIAALAREGLKPALVLLEEGAGDTWPEAEARWIRHYRDAGAALCNASDGGEGMVGHAPSSETRAKMAAAQRALGGANRVGKTHSEETKARISAAKRGVPNEGARARMLGKKQDPAMVEARVSAMRGRTLSAETRAKISAAHIGKTASAETRARMSEAAKRRGRSPEAAKKSGDALRGRKRPPEVGQKISAAKRAAAARRRAGDA